MKVKYLKSGYNERKTDIDRIRTEVYIVEQNVPELLEFIDDEEPSSIYFLAEIEGDLVGIARLRELSGYAVKMERVAVLKEFRGKGIATEICRHLLRESMKKYPERLLYAYAQDEILTIYEKLGFQVVSDVFLEDGTDIPHRTIVFPEMESLSNFLKKVEIHRNSDPIPYQPYDPRILSTLMELHDNISNLTHFNLNKLGLFLDSSTLSKFLVDRFYRFTANVEKGFLTDSSVDGGAVTDAYEFLSNLAYNKLNTGHFSEVDESWRVLYGLVHFVWAYKAKKRGDFKVGVEHCDLGLCMGRVDEKICPIRQLAELCHDRLEYSTDMQERFLDQNPGRPLLSQTNSVPVVEGDNYETLLLSVLQSSPIVIRKFAAGMPAVQKWSFPYLLKKMHSRKFPIEIGSKYSDENWSQSLMTFGQFLNDPRGDIMYLAQHRVIDQVKCLQEDFIIPDICYHRVSENQVETNMWIGPAGTVSPLHTDPRDNIFVQVKGTKVVRLVDPKDSHILSPHEGMLSNTSQLDAESDEDSMFKAVKKYDVTMSDGDVLFIPKGWWHYLRSVTPSISLSFWFD